MLMTGLIAGIVTFVVVALILLAFTLHIVEQYERGVVFRFGRVTGEKQPGLAVIVPFVNVLRKVSFRIVTMPIQSQGIITRDNVSVDVSAVSYYRVVDATKSVVAIENIEEAINQIAQTTLRKVVGQHTLDEMLAETDKININPRSPDRRMGRARDPGRAEGHSAARDNEAGNGPPGRGGTGEAGEDHRGRGRVPRRGSARGRLGHHDGAPTGTPAP
jgi:hypothetical protein